MARLKTAYALVSALLLPVMAQPAFAEDDSLVRLPGSGEVKSDKDKSKLKSERLKPGGGLLASFDTNGDGRISEDELNLGIERAFVEADANGDGVLTAIEQQQWAADLPTRDDSLANPVRFDPNLDRRVSFQEFSSVITDLSRDYRGDGHAELRVASLRAPKKARDDRPTLEELQDEQRGGLPGRPEGGSDF
ncbi:MAG: EF-hand domain-containing protein [Pseudomonadota bacterium]|nr:EF-hand domain-containing protein [Pseudomonadota bacterium]